MDGLQKPKIIRSDADVREAIRIGIKAVYDPVSSTLGSKGRNVLIELNWGPPLTVHDGVTVARSIVLADPFANAAAQSVIAAAQKTNNEAGDGTTTATILTYAITKEALEVIAAGTNPAPVRRGIDKAVAAVIEELKRIKKPVNTLIEMEQVATISAADEKIGKEIALAVQKVGEHGIVSVQESPLNAISVEYKEGLEFEKGWLSPYLVTDKERMEAAYNSSGKDRNDAPHVLVVDEELDNEKLLFLVQVLLETDANASLLIIANSYAPEAVETIVLTKLRSGKKWVAVKSADFGDHRTNQLHDIATITGGKVFGGATGLPFSGEKEDVYKCFGRADRVLVSQIQTLVIGGRGNKKDIQARVNSLKKELAESKSDGSRDKTEKRLAKLIGGVAVISVGANSEQEIRELKERVIDAVNSTKNAVEEGIVPGGGVALIRASKAIAALELPDSEKVGATIVKKALFYPMRKLVANAGADDPGFVTGKILENDDPNLGYNVNSEAFENMFDSGIIDPVKVSRCALQNAASTAIMLMMANYMIAYDRDSTKKQGGDNEGIADFIG